MEQILPTSSLLTFWGLFLTYALGPFAIFAFLNRLFGGEATRQARFLVACLGLGPLFLSWLLLALMAAMPGRPYSFHLWTVSGVALLLLAISERSGLECAKNAGSGFLLLLNQTQETLKNWRSNWPSFLLLAVAASFLSALFILCLALPPSGADALMSLSLAIDGFGKAAPSADVSPYGGLLIWSCIFQGSAAESGVAKFICPAFAVYASLLALALPLRGLFERCVALCLVVAAVFPHALLLDSMTLQIYPALLLLFLALSFKKGTRLFVCVAGAIALASMFRLCKFATLPPDGRLYLLAAIAAAVAVAYVSRGAIKTALLGMLSLSLFVPLTQLSLRKTSEFPLAWEIPTLPEMAIVDNSANGRFALFAYIHSNVPPEAVTLTPFPWDFNYYAPGRPCLGLGSGVNRLRVTDGGRTLLLDGVDFVCLPPRVDAMPELRLLEEFAATPEHADKVFEHEGWRIYKLKHGKRTEPDK